MAKKAKSIPINNFGGDAGSGIVIEKLSFTDLPNLEEWSQPERHDRHSFFLLESGRVTMEIDFQKYNIHSPAIIYMHPDQVHRVIGFENVTVSSWAMNDESLNPDYLKLLADITPATPLLLSDEMFKLVAETASLCIKFSLRKNDKIHHSLLKDSCNTLVALILSQYTEQLKPADKLSRFETVTKAFRETLEQNYITIKSPADYAQKLNISAPYLNECVKSTTGHPVSYHIQQRIILEAKRLLYHSNQSVKEISAALGYDDYPYFSRLFTKTTGMSALTFRNKNLD